MHQLVRALSRESFEEAASSVRQLPDDPWDADRIRQALAPFFEEYQRIVFDPRARQAHLTHLVERGPRLWDVHQVLVDERGDDTWNVEGEIDLRDELPPESPLVAIRRIGT
jgi:hypothetical protein